MVGIVSRANLMREMASLRLENAAPSAGPTGGFAARFWRRLGKQHWAPDINVEVKYGVVELSGVITDEHERQGLIVLVENVPGVKKVHDHLVWVEPMSAMAFPRRRMKKPNGPRHPDFDQEGIGNADTPRRTTSRRTHRLAGVWRYRVRTTA